MKILIAPLDWGLGHCSRCVPIINYLMENGVEVSIAGNQEQLTYFSIELKNLPIFHMLEGYNVRYGYSKIGTLAKVIQQVPVIIKSIRKEQQWLAQHLAQYHYDALISDNRYGFCSKKVYSIFITHQINIQAPMLSRWLNKINHRYIKQFDICWIPDNEAPNQLGGLLSNAQQAAFSYKYIGALSRFDEPIACTNHNESILLLLSGVQPQKDMFRDLIIEACARNHKQLCIVGNSSAYEKENITSSTTLSTEELKNQLAQHTYIISRNGYSTLMDLYYLQRRALLVPTPGQTEQEHLATAAKDAFHVYQAQHEFDLIAGLAHLKNKVSVKPALSPRYKLVLNELLATLSKK